MMRFKILVGTLLSAVLVGTMMAESRPVTVNQAADGPGGNGEATLQQILNCVYTGPTGCATNSSQILGEPTTANPGAPGVQSGQLNAQLFGVNPGTGTSLLTFAFGYTAGTDGFGIYAADNPAVSFLLFAGGAGSVGANAVVNFATGACTGCAGGSTLPVGINGSSFGVFEVTNVGGGHTYYSQDVFNPGQLAQILSYQPNVGGSDITFAGEDISRVVGGGSDNDFQDMIVVGQSISAVPEPASLLLFGTGLSGVAAMFRRRIKK